MGPEKPKVANPKELEALLSLFDKLDTNQDGVICISDLKEAVKSRQIPEELHSEIAKDFLNRSDLNKDGRIDFQEFIRFVVEHDRKLRLAFDKLDQNDDGHIDAKEIKTSLKDLGVHIDDKEATKLLKRMDQDGTLKIDFQEWREYLLFHPDASNLKSIVGYWRHTEGIDVGEDINIPDDYSTEETGVRLLNLITGGVAGMVSRTMTAPLDRLKVMRQVYGYKHRGARLSAAVHYMYQEGGVWSMWRGNGINVMKIAPETALKYFCYDKYKSLMGDSGADLPMSHKFVAGSMAGATAQTVIYPMEVLKTRMCLRKTGQYSSLLDCALKVYQEGGYRAFYRGYLANLLGIIPYAGIEMALYETCKRTYMRWKVRADDSEGGQLEAMRPPKYIILTSSAFSSICGQVVSYPLALMRTKMQSKSSFSEQRLNTLSGLFRKIVEEEGPRGLYRGFYPNMLKVLPAVMISFSTYEFLNEKFGLHSMGST